MPDLISLSAEPADDQTLVDLIDRVLDVGVVVEGDLTLSVADIDLVHVGLRLFISSAERRDGLSAAAGSVAA